MTVAVAHLRDVIKSTSCAFSAQATIENYDQPLQGGTYSAKLIADGPGEFTVQADLVFSLPGKTLVTVDVSDPSTRASASIKFYVDTKTTETPLPTTPWGLVTGPDGNLWVGVDSPSAGVDRVTPQGIVTHFSTGLAGHLAIGSDNNVWFTLSRGIGRLTTDGVFTQFPMNRAESQAWAIAAGPDDNLWLVLNDATASQAASIGRLTPASGAIQEFSTPTATSFPEGICAGPDGALWFTEYFAGNIGRVTTAGAFTEFRILTPNSKPVDIAVGPDQNLWFTEWATGKIGRITPAGKVTEFSAAPIGGNLNHLGVGPGGAIWFTTYGTSYVGSIDAQGTVTAYPLLSGAWADSIAAGPDNAVWYTAQQANSQTPGGWLARLMP